MTSYLRRKREESGRGSSEVEKPPYKTAKETELISEDDDEDNTSLKDIWKIAHSIKSNTKQLLDDNLWLKKQFEEIKASLNFHTQDVDASKQRKENIALKKEV